MGFTRFMVWVFGDTLVEDVVLSTLLMPKTKTIPKVGKLYIYRSEQFQFKQIVSDFIEELVERSAKNAERHISQMKYATFCYGELQMHSILVPAISQLSDCFILEYPIKRGKNEDSGRVDYYCINRAGTNNEYHVFLELKCGRQGIPNTTFRKNNIELWHEANTQLDGILQEIQNNREFYDKPIIRVCMEIIVLYADESKEDRICSNSKEILLDTFNSSIDTLDQTGVVPNISILWEFHPNIVKQAVDEYHPNRQFWGLQFLCRIIPEPN